MLCRFLVEFGKSTFSPGENRDVFPQSSVAHPLPGILLYLMHRAPSQEKMVQLLLKFLKI